MEELNKANQLVLNILNDATRAVDLIGQLDHTNLPRLQATSEAYLTKLKELEILLFKEIERLPDVSERAVSTTEDAQQLHILKRHVAMAATRSVDAEVEYLDVLTSSGEKTGRTEPRAVCHKEGLYHRATHLWVFNTTTKDLLVQKRAKIKDSHPGLWDVSSAGHITAGDDSLSSALRECHEEIGLDLKPDDVEYLFTHYHHYILNDGTFDDKEFKDVYITTVAPPIEQLTLQVEEVEAVRYVPYVQLESELKNHSPQYVPCDLTGYTLFDTLRERYPM